MSKKRKRLRMARISGLNIEESTSLTDSPPHSQMDGEMKGDCATTRPSARHNLIVGVANHDQPIKESSLGNIVEQVFALDKKVTEILRGDYRSIVTTDVTVEMTIGNHGDVQVSAIRSARLPWLDVEYRDKVGRTYQQDVKQCPKLKFNSNLVRLICKTILEQGLSEDASVPLELNLLPRVYWNLWSKEDEKRIELMRGYDSCSEAIFRYKQNARRLRSVDLDVKIVDIEPFQPISVTVEVRIDCFLDSISFVIDNENVDIAICKPMVAGRKETFSTIKIPSLSTLLDWQKNKGSVKCNVLSEEMTVSTMASVAFKADCFTDMANLSVDVGSTVTKMIFTYAQDLNDDLPHAYNSAAAAMAIPERKYCHDTMATNRASSGKSFCDDYDLPTFNKENFANLFAKGDGVEGVAKLSNFIETAIKRIARRIFEKEHIIIANVFWAFPNLSLNGCRLDFEKISSIVSAKSRPYILGSFTCVAEHEALKHMFTHVLRHLYQVAYHERIRIDTINHNRDQVARIEFEKEQQAYEAELSRLSGFWNILKRRSMRKNAPQRNAVAHEELASCFRRCLRMGRKEELENFLILDAGGCTLDVYGEIDKRAEVETSYKAGGESITTFFENMLIEHRNWNRDDKDLHSKAESLKCQTAEYVEEESNALVHQYKDWLEKSTKDVYEKPLKEIREMMRGANPLVVVVTGGGAKNPAFLNMVEDMFGKNGETQKSTLNDVSDEQNQNSIDIISTRTLGGLVIQDKKLTADKVLYAFAACSHDQGFKGDDSQLSDNNPATERYDVAGGLLIKYQTDRG